MKMRLSDVNAVLVLKLVAKLIIFVYSREFLVERFKVINNS